MADSVLQNNGKPFFPSGCAVVIGGSGGIGGAICRGLAKHGTDVVLSYRSSATTAATVAASVKEHGAQALALPLALEDRTSVIAFFEKARAWRGRVHSVICATGADISMTYVTAADPDEWRRTIDADLNGFFYVVQAAIPLLREGGGGAIVAMTTAGNIRHPAMDILSTVPKAGIEAIIRGVAREEGRYGIRANSVALGVIDGGLFPRLKTRVSAEFVKAMKRNTALRRFGHVDEAADAAIFLSCARSSYITGTSLFLDGGYSI